MHGPLNAKKVYSFSVSVEMPRISCNPNFNCRVHDSPDLDPVLSQINPVRATPSCLLEEQL